MYPGLDFDQDELTAAMREGYDDLIAFITRPAFQALHAELMALPATERPGFVSSVILSPDELAARGIDVPEGILIQASAFGDRRPTLFAVKKFLPKKFHKAWENVNWTFSNDFNIEDIRRDPENAWRPPLPVSLQNALMSADQALESVPETAGINHDFFESKLLINQVA
jgi:hypothetical protein